MATGSPGEYRFKIDVFTPATLPMRRLAEYMLEVARLLGEPEHVHFEAVKKGSAILVSRIDFEALPKVRQRVRAAAAADAPDELRRPWRKIDGMLADDNAVGSLAETGKTGVVVEFPGRMARSAPIGPIAEDGAIEGQLVRIGGEDKTAHALVQTGLATVSCEVSRETAKALGAHLYGKPLRFNGRGRWMRSAQGDWELLDFKARDFVVLDDAPVGEIMDRLGKIEGNEWRKLDDPLATWSATRRGK